MRVADICTRELVTIAPDEGVVEAARRMREFHVGTLLVVDRPDRPRPLGIVTDRDLVISVLAIAPETASTLTAGDVMSSDPTTVDVDATVSDALSWMRAAGVRRLPVVDADGCLVGIVSADDVVTALARDLLVLADVYDVEQQREITRRPAKRG